MLTVKISWSSVLISIVLFSMFFSFLYMDMLLLFCFFVSSFILLYIERKYLFIELYNKTKTIEVLFMFLVIMSMPLVFLNNYSTPIYLALTFWSILLTMVFLKQKYIALLYNSIRHLLCFCVLATLLYLYSTYGKYRVGYQLEYMINESVSANGVTSFLNILLGVYTILKFKLKEKNTLILSFLVFYISIEGYGRGSIIFSLIMLLINLFFIFFRCNVMVRFFLGLVFFTCIVLLTPYIHEALLKTKLASGFDTPRFLILKEYLNRIDVFSFFFSMSYEGTVISDEYNNNPHVTYIRTHHVFGFFYLLGLVFIISKAVFYAINSKNMIDFLILLIIFNILIRIFTEPLLFPSLFDSLFFTSLFLLSKNGIKYSFNKGIRV